MTTKQKIFVKVPGKALVLGEYSVLLGGQALLVPAPCSVQGCYEANSDLKLHKKIAKKFESDDQNNLWQAFLTALKDFGQEVSVGDYFLDSSQFFDKNNIKYGFGSSAACSVALAKLDQKINHRTKKFSYNLAQKIHEIFSGAFGSGADIAACFLGEKINFSQKKINKINFDSSNFIFIYTGKEQSTKIFVKNFFNFIDKNFSYGQKFLKQSDHLISLYLKGNNYDKRVAVINCFYDLLVDLGQNAGIDIISKEHAHINYLAQKYNGAAKPSGAGGGDIALAVIADDKVDPFIKDIKTSGYKII